MSSLDTAKAIEQLNVLAAQTQDPAIQELASVLGDAISVGNISNATGVAVGRNIRQVINNFNLPHEAVAALLDLRQMLGKALYKDTGYYHLGTIIADKARDFVGRDYVFEAIDQFLESQPNGYFSIIGPPGLGKTAIIAEYLRRKGCIAHFNVRALGVTNARQFLENVCTQLIIDSQLPHASLPANALQDGAFLLKLLYEAGQKLAPGDRIVILVDALDEAELGGNPPGANVLFLPKTLPQGVYFVMTRRPASVPLVVEAPHQSLDLMAHSTENRDDIESYLRRTVKRPALHSWINVQGLSAPDFVTKLADLSESNFMYLRYVLPEIEGGAYQSLSIEKLPSGLEGYYEDHWRQMGMTAKPLPRIKIRIVYILCEVRQPVSRKLLSEFASDQAISVDELTVQEVLDEWRQFLLDQRAPEGARYGVYHSSFRDFLHRKDIVQAVGVTIKDINALIANNLWDELFGQN